MTGGDHARKQGDNDKPAVIVCFALDLRRQLHVDFNPPVPGETKMQSLRILTRNLLIFRSGRTNRNQVPLLLFGSSFESSPKKESDRMVRISGDLTITKTAKDVRTTHRMASQPTIPR
jgi:hypothetical protein